MKPLNTNKLFTPIQVGPLELKHRVVMAPLTRSRSIQPGSIPGDMMLEYYSQRASDGGLIVSEGTSISIAGGGWFGAPGLYSEEQVSGWKRITDAVHRKRGSMFFPTLAYGACRPCRLDERRNPCQFFGQSGDWQDSTIKRIYAPWLASAFASPRAPTSRKSRALSEDYRKAAERAKAARFDGVELSRG